MMAAFGSGVGVGAALLPAAAVVQNRSDGRSPYVVAGTTFALTVASTTAAAVAYLKGSPAVAAKVVPFCAGTLTGAWLLGAPLSLAVLSRGERPGPRPADASD